MDSPRIITAKSAKYVAIQIKSVAHETRLKILVVLLEGEKPLRNIVLAVGEPYPNVLQHIRVLVRANWVRRKTKERPVYLLTNYTVTERIIFLCNKHCEGLVV
jgi:DNA-binding transcriptional ArsR family regulator